MTIDYDDLWPVDAVPVALNPERAFELIADLREQVAAKDAEIARLLHLINMDFDCLPTCDKFGHEPECPYCNGEPKLRILAERAEKAEAENATLREQVDKNFQNWLSAEKDLDVMRKSCAALVELCEHANPGAWHNGVESNGIQEGDYLATCIIDDARAALLAGKEKSST